MFLFILILIFLTFLAFYLRVVPKKSVPKELLEADVKWVQKNISFYHLLDAVKKKRFLQRIAQFIETVPIHLENGNEAENELKLLVASAAVCLTLEFENWQFRSLQSVLLVDGILNKQSSNQGAVLGEVKVFGNKNTMALSIGALKQGFANFNDKQNVAIHEFAHVLDAADGSVDGIPSLLFTKEQSKAWKDLVEKKIGEIEAGDIGINPYGATNSAEFFAVSCEYFFERPLLMQQKHPELYQFLQQAFKATHQEKVKSVYRELSKNSSQGRNALCACGSGKKFKKCCGK